MDPRKHVLDGGPDSSIGRGNYEVGEGAPPVVKCRDSLHHNHFTALFLGPPGWAGARRELLDFMVQRKINRGRHTDHPAGHHSIRTNQCPPSKTAGVTYRYILTITLSIFYRPDALPAAQPTVSKHWRHIGLSAVINNGIYYSNMESHCKTNSWSDQDYVWDVDCGLRVGPRKHVLDGVHIGAACQIWVTCPCAALMRLFC